MFAFLQCGPVTRRQGVASTPQHQFVARGKVGVPGVEVLIGGSATPAWDADLAGIDLP